MASELSNLLSVSEQKRTRVGRGIGSGKGKTCGRGMKGQKSRSGGKVPRWFEGGQMPMQRRLPKRGFKNIFARPVEIVRLCRLVGVAERGAIDPELMVKSGLVTGKGRIKVLGGEPIDCALHVKAHAFSAQARALIERAGGTAEEL